MGIGVFLGAKRANQDPVAMSTPVSIRVGTSGRPLERILVETASAFNWSDLINCMTDGTVANIYCSLPATKSRVASAPL